jgi:hypothetical protein
MHRHIKIPNRIIPIKLVGEEIYYKNKKNKGCQSFKKFFSVHLSILPYFQEKPKKKSAIAEFFLGLFLMYYRSLISKWVLDVWNQGSTRSKLP